MKQSTSRRNMSVEDEYAEDSDLSDCEDDDDEDLATKKCSYCYPEDPVSRWRSSTRASKPTNLLEAGKSMSIK